MVAGRATSLISDLVLATPEKDPNIAAEQRTGARVTCAAKPL